eukprot:3830882-Prymnesium_polylepis.1
MGHSPDSASPPSHPRRAPGRSAFWIAPLLIRRRASALASRAFAPPAAPSRAPSPPRGPSAEAGTIVGGVRRWGRAVNLYSVRQPPGPTRAAS